MKLLSALAFWRKPTDAEARIEDGAFINLHADIYGVTDGNSAAHSPSNPPLLYGCSTGAQMVNGVIAKELAELDGSEGLEDFLFNVNYDILSRHRERYKDPTKGDDVGGACFSFCQPSRDGLQILLGGDAFAFVKTRKGPVFWTGFDEAAFENEEKHQKIYEECKELARGNIGAAWDLYFPAYTQKRIFCKNRHIGEGGDASLNGDPLLTQSWKEALISWKAEPELVLLGTDGMLPGSEVHPKKFPLLSSALSQLYIKGGIPAILAWRDRLEREIPSTAHLKGQPEATAVELKFG